MCSSLKASYSVWVILILYSVSFWQSSAQAPRSDDKTERCAVESEGRCPLPRWDRSVITATLKQSWRSDKIPITSPQCIKHLVPRSCLSSTVCLLSLLLQHWNKQIAKEHSDATALSVITLSTPPFVFPLHYFSFLRFIAGIIQTPLETLRTQPVLFRSVTRHMSADPNLVLNTKAKYKTTPMQVLPLKFGTKLQKALFLLL